MFFSMFIAKKRHYKSNLELGRRWKLDRADSRGLILYTNKGVSAPLVNLPAISDICAVRFTSGAIQLSI